MSAATIAANLRPTLPGCASAMARDPVRGSIMYDGGVCRHRAPRGPPRNPMVMAPEAFANSRVSVWHARAPVAGGAKSTVGDRWGLQRMVQKSVQRFSEKNMRKQQAKAR